jgi:microcystin-dependent protein
MSCIQPCDPCETSIAEECAALEETTSASRLVVEDIASCKKAIQSPENISILQCGDDGDISWRDGSSDNIFGIPNLQDHDIDSAPKIIVTDNTGTLKQWEPSSAGNNFVAYWDGNDFVIGTLSSLFPAGNGVFVKSGNNLSFVNGINGQILTISGSIQFATIALGQPPVGTILPYGGAVAPAGYFLCDGSAINRITYSSLFALIGTTYGPGDNTTTFNIPDYRGVFLRGLDISRTMGSLQNQDIHLHTHTLAEESSHTHTISGNTEPNNAAHQHYVSNIDSPGVLSVQPLTSTNYLARKFPIFDPFIDYELQGTTTVASIGLTSNQIQGHTHSFSLTSNGGSAHSHSIDPDGSTETRPINLALNFIIKT